MEQDNEYIINTPSIKIKSALVGGILVAIFVFWIVSKMIAGSYGKAEIGSYWEKDSYTTQYWVYLQPDNAEVKNYRVKGDIEHYNDEGNYYYLRRVYWDNGGYIDFDECEITELANDAGKDNHAYCSYEDGGYTIRLGEKVKQ